MIYLIFFAIKQEAKAPKNYGLCLRSKFFDEVKTGSESSKKLLGGN